MSYFTSKFESLIGDVNTFEIMLSGAFSQWPGTYDVLLHDVERYLLQARQKMTFRAFCRRVCASSFGENICRYYDREAASRVARSGETDIYPCHAGLLNIAVPVLVNEIPIATVLWGRVRSINSDEDQESLQRVKYLERKLETTPGELVQLWKQIPQLPSEKLTQTITRVDNLLHYIVKLCHKSEDRVMVSRREWVRAMTYQLLTPIHSLQGYADNAKHRLQDRQMRVHYPVETYEKEVEQWQQELAHWKDTCDAIVWLSHYATRLAHNLAWTLYAPPMFLELTLVEDLSGLLISCARDFQGLARERNLHRVHVDIEKTRPLNSKVCLCRDTFRQALGNLLDNAIKYADPHTEVLIEGELIDDQVILRVINVGLRLHVEDVDKIFETGFRAIAAHYRNAAGAGLGLPIAQEIMALHKGTLTVSPSETTANGWRTVVTMTLPVCETDT